MDCISTRCPEFKCNEVVTANFFANLVPEEKLAAYHRYNKLLSSSLISDGFVLHLDVYSRACMCF
jgi:hypothetical protein